MNVLIPSFGFFHDPLTLFFLAILIISTLASAMNAVGYLKGHNTNRAKILFWIFFVIFVMAMAFVFSVNNAFAFLIAWECMSLFSYFLVISDNKEMASVRSGFIYLVMTHAGTVCLIVAMLLLNRTAGTFDIVGFQSAFMFMPATEQSIVFLLFLVGFGTKAGLVPLHVWLPYAHPQAPSPVSALMSGVMLKTAVYGFIRFVMEAVTPFPAWWSWIIIAIALLSCLVGVMYALIENDIKKLLAYSSIENMGIIFLGLGGSTLFFSLGAHAVAAMTLAAALFHVLNHAIFKGTLFLTVGNVFHETGTRSIEKLGGLIKLMPVTAVSFFVGALAVAAVPPFNGFASEWMLFQSFLNGAAASTGTDRIFIVIAVAGFALTGALAASAFVKAFGITFLAMPRSENASRAKESSAWMTVPVVILSILCVALGLGSRWLIPFFIQISSAIFAIPATEPVTFESGLSFAANSPYVSSFAALICAALLLALAVLAFLRNRNGSRRVGIWDCGYYSITPRNEYTATGFSKPFRLAFSFFFQPYRRTEKIRDTHYKLHSFKYEVHTIPVFKKYIYRPVIGIVMWVANKVRHIQPGSIHLYLAYILFTILILIAFFGGMK